LLGTVEKATGLASTRAGLPLGADSLLGRLMRSSLKGMLTDTRRVVGHPPPGEGSGVSLLLRPSRTARRTLLSVLALTQGRLSAGLMLSWSCASLDEMRDRRRGRGWPTVNGGAQHDWPQLAASRYRISSASKDSNSSFSLCDKLRDGTGISAINYRGNLNSGAKLPGYRLTRPWNRKSSVMCRGNPASASNDTFLLEDEVLPASHFSPRAKRRRGLTWK